MRPFLITLLLFLSGCGAQVLESPSFAAEDQVKPVLLLELFTSEGCSSCPPAEELLAKFEREQPFEAVELVTLAFHVDYWDSLGWKDKYASPLFTQRQKVYDRKFRTGQIYTPQIVVDGDIEFIGSREKDAERAVKKAAKRSKASVQLRIEGSRVEVSITGIETDEPATLYIAVAEDNISSDVRRGENAGKKLTHLSVVRSLRGVAMIEDGSNAHNAGYDLQIDEEWNRDNLKIVVFAQQNGSRDVIAVGQARLSDHQRVS